MHTWYFLLRTFTPSLLIIDVVGSYFYLVQNYFAPLVLLDGVWYVLFVEIEYGVR